MGMSIIEPVPSCYPEKKKRFKSKVRKCGVKKDKPTYLSPLEIIPLEGYLI
jgi:hypothetical protein